MISILLGTRPEIIKMSPIINYLEDEEIEYEIIHTGQHYSKDMDSDFFATLDLPSPDYNLGLNKMSNHERAGKMIAQVGNLLEDTDILMVQGDTDTVLAGSIAAEKTNTVLGHVEAGLRSGNKNMPEEKNRIVADHVADHLFCPTSVAKDNVLAENIDQNVHVTGNTIVDAVNRNLQIAQDKNSIGEELPEDYAVATVHRAANVENSQTLAEIIDALSDIDFPVIFPAHPRTKDRIEDFGIEIPENVVLKSPMDYLDFLYLLSEAKIVLTDSGGVQEEACILKVPCITIRSETERPETLQVGANMVSGTNKNKIIRSAKEMLSSNKEWENPFGDGKAAEKIVGVLKDENIV